MNAVTGKDRKAPRVGIANCQEWEGLYRAKEMPHNWWGKWIASK
jgi:hypothetical protein